MHEQTFDNQKDGNGISTSREVLAGFLKSDEYIFYAGESGPLLFADLPDEAQERTLEVAEAYGWPDESDGNILPTHSYTTESFVANLFNHSMSDEGLNNFYLNVKAVPRVDMSGIKSTAEFYGFSRMVHRANALAPEFFGALRTAVDHFDMADQATAREFLQQPENKDIAEAIHMAYMIMGRLWKTTDNSVMNVATDEVRVTDAHVALTA